MSELRDKVRSFRSRDHPGRVLAGMLGKFKGTDSLILAIPSGGIPVGVAAAEAEIIVVVPTGSADRVRKVAREVDALYCANIREGWGFAVAEAYQRWVDLEEEGAARLYKDYQTRFEKASIPI